MSAHPDSSPYLLSQRVVDSRGSLPDLLGLSVDPAALVLPSRSLDKDGGNCTIAIPHLTVSLPCTVVGTPVTMT